MHAAALPTSTSDPQSRVARNRSHTLPVRPSPLQLLRLQGATVLMMTMMEMRTILKAV